MKMTESSLKVHAFRMLPDEEISAKLVEFVRVNDIKAAFVMTCCGSVKCVTLRFATPKESAAGKEKVHFLTVLKQYVSVRMYMCKSS